MQKLTELFEKLGKSLEVAKLDAEEFSSGKKAAAGRLRKEAQTSKKLWQEVRIFVIGQLKTMPVKKREKK